MNLNDSPLGKETVYKDEVDNTLLFAIPRSIAREKIGLIDNLPFEGIDIWNGYEFSWKNKDNNYQFAGVVIKIPANSPNIIESKSLKLYLYSFANSKFESKSQLLATITNDLSESAKAPVSVEILTDFSNITDINSSFNGNNIDDIDVTINTYHVDPSLLKHDCYESDKIITENLYSDLLRSNCLVTGKPDWGSIKIHYTGNKISHKSLLKYIISYRDHQGFHEQCVEQIFTDINNTLQPEKLLVEARYTRRGSLDINPIRTNFSTEYKNSRLFRQ